MENWKGNKTRAHIRKEDSCRNKEKQTNTLKRKKTNTDKVKLIDKFHKTVMNGRANVCHLCKQLWYRQSVCN